MKIKGKSAVIGVPCEEENPETVALLVAFFEKCFRYLQMKLIGTIIVPGVSQKGEILKKPDSLKESYELGRKLVKYTNDS